MSDNLEKCRAILKKRCSELMAIENVVATGIGYKISNDQVSDTLSIICSVTQKKSVSDLNPDTVIPQTVEGIPTDVIETGVIEAFQNPTERFRPAPGGVSIGHIDITAGTLGCWVRRGNETFLLSNNHVIANSNAAAIGDPIVQPGPTDGGRNPQDQIATLEDFVRIIFPGDPGGGDGGNGGGGGGGINCGSLFGLSGGNDSDSSAQMNDNLVDAAIARPLTQDLISFDILDIGSIQGIEEASLGMALKKFGRTTRLTQGSVLQIDATVNVSYGAGRVATFTDQLMAGAMSQGGDSGSAVLNGENRLVGLLFAGSANSTIINRIQNVFSSLNITL